MPALAARLREQEANQLPGRVESMRERAGPVG